MTSRMTRKENVTFAKRYIIDSIWREANLEGINATFPDTQEVYYGRSVPNLKVDEIIAINNLKHGWQFILDTLDETITVNYLREVNKLIGQGIIAGSGEIRSTPVRISGTSYVPGIPTLEKCERLLQEITSVQNPTEKGVIAFLKIAKAQLFIDGNKRTAQLIANKILIENGCGIYSVPVEKVHEFTGKLIEYYEADDDKADLNYFEKVGVQGH